MNQRKIGIVISYINIALHALIGFAYVPLLLHYIGQSEYGLYQLIGSLIAYFSVMDFGLSHTVVRFYARYLALDDRRNMENILAVALRAYGVITLGLFLVGAICYFFLPELFGASMTREELLHAQDIFLLLLLNIVLTISTMIFRAVINAHECFLVLKGMETVQLVLQPIMVVLLLTRYPSAYSVALVQTLLNVPLIAVRIWYCFAVLRIRIVYHYFNRELWAEFKKLAGSLFIVAIIDQIFWKTNQVVLGVYSGTAAVAVYSISSIIYMNYMSLSVAISGVFLPLVSQMVAVDAPRRDFTALMVKIGRLQYLLLALIASGFIIFGREFILLWAGASFADAYWITLLIILPFTVDLIQNIGNSILQAMNRYDYCAKVLAFTAVLNLLCVVPMAQRYGGIGCALVTGAAMLLSNGFIMNRFYYREIGLDIPLFWREIIKISLPLVPLCVLGFVANDAVGAQGKLVLLAKILLYTLLYCLVAYRFTLNEEEHARLRNVLGRLRGR
jgi:O-antigen/teichoic acid export membrane protein